MKKVFAFALTLLTVSTTTLSFGNPELTPPADSSTLQIRITDSDINSFSLNIQIVNVEAYNENLGWITLNDYQQNISSLSFTSGNESLLANSVIPSGSYTKLRFTFGESNSIYSNSNSDWVTSNLTFAGDHSKQVELKIDQHLGANDTNEVRVRFDIANSVSVVEDDLVLNPVFEELKNPATIVKDALVDFTALSAR